VTHEPEITEPVDLCLPDGSALEPAARGWSRRPLHRANLRGEHGRNKRWDYWAVLAGDLVVSWVYSDVDHFGLADVFWADLVTGASGGQVIVVGPEHGMALPERCGTVPLRVTHNGFSLSIVDDVGGTRTRARWTEADGRIGSLDVHVALPVDHESLNVVIPWDAHTFNFTSKHQARAARGRLTVGDQVREIGADHDAWGVLDVGRGRWPASITWNWGGGAGRAGDHVVGIQIGGRWTEGTGFTENGVIVDGRLTKIGTELVWRYDWDAPLEPWTVDDPAGRLHLTLTPRYDKHTDSRGRRRSSEVHQVFGTWSGEITTDTGERITIDRIQGFAEEARQQW
jgi:hypothetical protein